MSWYQNVVLVKVNAYVQYESSHPYIVREIPSKNFLTGRTDGHLDRRTDDRGDSYIPPQTSFAGGINRHS